MDFPERHQSPVRSALVVARVTTNAVCSLKNDFGIDPAEYSVHPSVRHIRAYVSTLGASVALGDLDGDGLQNDVVWVDPPTDQVICGPVPGTGARYETFALDPGSSFPNWNPATMCPQGSLIADLNEDGLLDVLVVHWGRSPIVGQTALWLPDAVGRPAAAVPSPR